MCLTRFSYSENGPNFLGTMNCQEEFIMDYEETGLFDPLKRSALNLRHSVKAERVLRSYVARRSAKNADSGFSQNALMDIKAVTTVLSRSRASIYRDIRAERFPKPL